MIDTQMPVSGDLSEPAIDKIYAFVDFLPYSFADDRLLRQNPARADDWF